jgi:hypothetical protein
MLSEVTPLIGKAALGKWRAPNRNTVWTQCQTNGDNLNGCRAIIKLYHQGAYVSVHLSFGWYRKGYGEKLLLPTVLGKSDRPG